MDIVLILMNVLLIMEDVNKTVLILTEVINVHVMQDIVVDSFVLILMSVCWIFQDVSKGVSMLLVAMSVHVKMDITLMMTITLVSILMNVLMR
jgi:hypothetical protein